MDNNISRKVIELKNFIAGDWIAGGGSRLEGEDPSNQKPLWMANSATKDQIRIAAERASQARVQWSGLSFEERHSVLSSFGHAVGDNSDELALLISQEIGKPLWEARTEVAAVVGKLAPTVSAFRARAAGIQYEAKIQGIEAQVLTEFVPHGVVSVIGPYNFPLHMANGHIIPALLSGNAVLF